MSFFDAITSLFKRKRQPETKVEQKGWWNPHYGGTGFRSTYDAFGGQKEPSKADLVKAYDDITYACVSLISTNLAKVPIRLYVRTAPGDRKAKCATAPVYYKNAQRIHAKAFSSQVQEVINHPLLELVNECNSYHNKHDLLQLTSIYMDLTGNSYWLMEFNALQMPERLYLLPSHLVYPERDENYMVREWIFGQGTEEKRFSTREVIHFKYANPLDPYGEGMSPLRGAWGRKEISSKELSYLDNYLSNQGKPDAVLAIKDSISPVEAERVAKEFTHRFQGQGSGGLLVVDGSMNYSPLNYGAKDLAELQLYQVLKTTICNCFHIPPDIFELGTSSNRSTREAALYALAAQCLQPRLDAVVQKLNDKLVPFFDDRFFFEADCIVPDDKDYELQKMQLLLTQQVITRDEARIREGFVSAEWAQEPLLPSGVMPALAVDEEPQQEAPQEQDQLPDRTAQAQAIQALQEAFYSGNLPREAALANARLIYGFTPDEANALIPDAPPKAPAMPQEAPAQTPAPPQQEAKAHKRGLDMRSPLHLIRALKGFFAELKGDVVSRVKSMEQVETKALPVVDWFDADYWQRKMIDEFQPIISAYYNHAARETIANLGISMALFHTVQPKLKEGVGKSTLTFCEDTIATTSMELTTALDALRKEVVEGLEVGDVKNAMMERVQKVFDGAENYRAFRIGVTEASRGQHAAMEITATESGVVNGKTWLLSDDACPICKPLANKTVPMGENFTVDGSGPYAEIPYPPRHVNCRCTLLLDTGD